MSRTTLIYVSSVVLMAILFVAAHLPMVQFGQMTPEGWRVFFALIGVGILSQAAAIDFGRGRQATSSMAFIPFLSSAIVFPPAVTIIVAAIVIGVSEVTFTKRGFVKSSFNVAQLVLALGLAAHVYSELAGTRPEGEVALIGFAGLVITFFAVNIIFSSIALSLYREQPFVPTLKDVIGPRGGNLLYDILASPIVIGTVVLIRSYDYWGVLVIVLPLLLIRHFYLSRRQLEEANRDLLTVLIKAIEIRDPYTSGHSLRVSSLATLIAEDLHLSRRRVSRITTAALLHDIGKTDPIFATVISKPHALTGEERELIQTHAARGADLLRDLSSVEPEVVLAVRHHHERYDGLGYPDGIAGEDIPLSARIIMLSDSIDAMLSDRPYRSALPVAVVREELANGAGGQFDPRLVEAILAANTLERAIEIVGKWREEQPMEMPLGSSAIHG